MSIRIKVVFFFLFLSILPFAIISFLVYQQVSQTVESTAMNHISSLADLQKARIQQAIHFQTINVEHLAGQPEFTFAVAEYVDSPTSTNTDKLTKELRNLVKSVQSYKDASLLNADGTVLATTNPVMRKKPLAELPTLAEGTQHTDVSQFVKTETNEIHQYHLTPVKQNGRPNIILLVEVDANPILRIFQDETGLGKTGQLALGAYNKDHVGVVIVAGRLNPDPLGSFYQPIKNPSETKSPLRLAINRQEKTFTDTVTYQGTPVISSARYIPETGWGLVVTQDKSEVFAPLAILRRQFVLTISSFILFALIVSSLVARRFVSRLAQIKDGAQKIAQGELDTQVPIVMKDEIGDIAMSFNSMASSLSQSYRSISEAKLKDEIILEAIDEAIITVNTDGEVTAYNKKVNQFFNTEQPLALLGKKVFNCFQILDNKHQPIPVLQRPISLSLNDKRVVHVTNYYLVSNREFCVQIVSAPIIINDVLVGAVEIIRDMTKEKHVEAMKDEFLSIAAHQLRTPLGTTRWTLERLIGNKIGKLSAESKAALKNLAESNLRLIILVNSLLDVSRINQNRVEPHLEKVEIPSLLKSVVSQFSELAEEHKVSLHFSSSLEKNYTTRTDPKMLRVIVENLIENAVKYTQPKGTVSVDASIEKMRLQILIADTGIGIPQNDQRNLFEKFYRGTNVTKKGIDGTGLGLFIVRSYLLLLGGTIRLESEQDKGTTCTVLLPLSNKEVLS